MSHQSPKKNSKGTDKAENSEARHPRHSSSCKREVNILLSSWGDNKGSKHSKLQSQQSNGKTEPAEEGINSNKAQTIEELLRDSEIATTIA